MKVQRRPAAAVPGARRGRREHRAVWCSRIAAAKVRPGPGERVDLPLVGLLLLLGVALFVYLANAVIGRR